jgi:DNA-binding transcriptional MerR regulator
MAPAAHTTKSATALRTIREVAEILELPQHVLRFWETKFPQIQPLKRRGGRRFYRPEDIETLGMIRTLLHEQGYTIKGAQALLSGKASERAALVALASASPPPAAAGGKPTGRRSRLRAVRNELVAAKNLLQSAG